jgi:hypothetical protein
MARRPDARWVFGITAVALFMTALDNLVVITALPVIKGSFEHHCRAWSGR